MIKCKALGHTPVSKIVPTSIIVEWIDLMEVWQKECTLQRNNKVSAKHSEVQLLVTSIADNSSKYISLFLSISICYASVRHTDIYTYH